ncbi:MAG: hypothetical protein KDA28_07385, partial [Phycisphaerales bacterium]|nr:hypothetical protein [Phycisphaerales bacterium]
DAIIEQALGESSVEVTLWGDMSPDVDGTSVLGFASTMMSILASPEYLTGNILGFDPNPALFGAGGPTFNSLSIDVNAFQLDPFNNPGFDDSDPIRIFSFTWETFDYSPRTVGVSTTSANTFVWLDNGDDDWPTIEETGAWEITTLPAPGVLPILGVLAVARRRRA